MADVSGMDPPEVPVDGPAPVEASEGKEAIGIITIRIPRRLHVQVKAIAFARLQSMNAYVRQLLELAVQQAAASSESNNINT